MSPVTEVEFVLFRSCRIQLNFRTRRPKPLISCLFYISSVGCIAIICRGVNSITLHCDEFGCVGFSLYELDSVGH